MIGPDGQGNRPRVSVIMPVYNEERYVRQAVDSILRQTFTDFEFIILDDGSTDGTPDILRSYADPRIRVFSQPNAGLSPSLNRCLSLASARYLARMDGNDVSDPERLRTQVEFLDGHPEVGLLGAYYENIDDGGRTVKRYTYPTHHEEIRRALWSDCPMCHSLVMFRRACIDAVGGYRERIGPAEDYDLWFRISERFRLSNIPRSLHQVRVTPTGITLARRFDQLRAALLVRYLAQERQRLGCDSLDRLADPELDSLLERLLPRTPRNVRRVAHSTALYLSEVSYGTADYPCAARRLLEAVKLAPWHLRNWSLAWRLLACLLLPADVTRRLKTLYRRVAHVEGGE
ncbi:MAG: glycosyltransferase [candidate division NC10 bacterium]|nr:glycosyltransferase [candidate division NC10 bacterium]